MLTKSLSPAAALRGMMKSARGRANNAVKMHNNHTMYGVLLRSVAKGTKKGAIKGKGGTGLEFFRTTQTVMLLGFDNDKHAVKRPDDSLYRKVKISFKDDETKERVAADDFPTIHEYQPYGIYDFVMHGKQEFQPRTLVMLKSIHGEYYWNAKAKTPYMIERRNVDMLKPNEAMRMDDLLFPVLSSGTGIPFVPLSMETNIADEIPDPDATGETTYDKFYGDTMYNVTHIANAPEEDVEALVAQDSGHITRIVVGELKPSNFLLGPEGDKKLAFDTTVRVTQWKGGPFQSAGSISDTFDVFVAFWPEQVEIFRISNPELWETLGPAIMANADYTLLFREHCRQTKELPFNYQDIETRRQNFDHTYEMKAAGLAIMCDVATTYSRIGIPVDVSALQELLIGVDNHDNIFHAGNVHSSKSGNDVINLMEYTGSVDQLVESHDFFAITNTPFEPHHIGYFAKLESKKLGLLMDSNCVAAYRRDVKRASRTERPDKEIAFCDSYGLDAEDDCDILDLFEQMEDKNKLRFAVFAVKRPELRSKVTQSESFKKLLPDIAKSPKLARDALAEQFTDLTTRSGRTLLLQEAKAEDESLKRPRASDDDDDDSDDMQMTKKIKLDH